MKIKPGCGCAITTAALCAIVAIISAAVGYSYLVRSTGTLSSAPKPLPLPEISEEVEKTIATIEETFRQMVDGGKSGELDISPQVLNAWLRLSSRSELRFIAEHAWFALEGETLSADLSVPLAPVGFSGRYFNGRGVFQATIHNGDARLVILDLYPDGGTNPLFSWLTPALSKVNLASYIGIEEIIGRDLLERCDTTVEASALKLRCKTRAEGSPVGTPTALPLPTVGPTSVGR